MLAIQVTLGIVYFLGVVISFFKIHKHMSRSQSSKDEDELDALIALGGEVFWPIWILPYAIYRLFK